MLVPNKNRLLVKQIKKEESDKGIILEQGALMDHSLNFGEVISKNSEDFPKGTKIYYSEYSTARIHYEGDDIYIIPEVDIMAFEK